MKAKKVTFFTPFLFAIAIITFSGCEQDYYDPSRLEGTGSSLFGDSITVPSTFDWATTRSIDMRVEVDDSYNGAYYYTVQIFNDNPLFNEEVKLLGMGVAKSGHDFSSKIVLPNALSMVYIQQTSPTGGKVIAPVEVTGSSLNYSFGTPSIASLSSVSLRSASIYSASESADSFSVLSTSDQYTIPTTVTAITQTEGTLNLDLSKGPYLIEGNFNGRANFWNSGDIYVTGSFTVNENNFQLPSGSKLIVLEGASVTVNGNFQVLADAALFNNGTTTVTGKLQTSNANAEVINDREMTLLQLEITQNTGLFTNNGTLTVNDDLQISNNGKIFNNNTIRTKTVTLDNGTFENEGVITVEALTKVTNNTASIINHNSFLTDNLELRGNASVVNNCHLVVSDLLNTTDSEIKVNAGGLLSTANLEMNNTRIELGSASMMQITSKAIFEYNNGGVNGDGFFGVGDGIPALLIIEKAESERNNSENTIHYEGNLMIECYDHFDRLLKNGRATYTENGVTWAGEGGATLIIPATDCNDGGYGNSPTTPPSNPVFPIIWNGSDVTYLFEDYWPLLGDYDMNDVVLNVKPDYLLNASNKVESLNLEVTLRAVGGIKSLAVGLQIDGMARNMVAQVTRNNTSGIDNSVFAVSNGLETGQDYAVIPLFDDAHKALGIPAGTMINTTEGGGAGTVAPLRVIFSIYFTTPVDMETVAIYKLNPFIVNGGYENKRDEVHMSGFAPTNKADTRKFGTGDDASDIRYYTSRANMIWALAIPDSIPYPKENFSIKMAYPQIESWATSAGELAKDWYLYPEQSFIYGL